jgi:hypothetical protein
MVPMFLFCFGPISYVHTHDTNEWNTYTNNPDRIVIVYFKNRKVLFILCSKLTVVEEMKILIIIIMIIIIFTYISLGFNGIVKKYRRYDIHKRLTIHQCSWLTCNYFCCCEIPNLWFFHNTCLL